MTAEHKYEMTISLQIVEHLGLNLYSNTSAVISEAVANAWDADAKTVEITLEKDCITIKDDGCGMDTDDINNKYLTVGYQKRHLVPITPMLNRKVMGRKGIGKLSLLSIAETITIYSSKNGQKNALQISTQKLREAVSQTQTSISLHSPRFSKNMIQTRILKSSYFLVNAWMAKKLITILKANICASLLKLTHESYIMINCWQMPKLFMQISLRKIAALHHLRH